jgi:hypothetical protein
MQKTARTMSIEELKAEAKESQEPRRTTHHCG